MKVWLTGGSVGLFVVLALPTLRLRLWRLVTLHSDSLGFRWDTCLGSLHIWWDHLLTGSGPGTFFAMYPAVRNTAALHHAAQASYEVTHPENWIAQSLSETGLLGLVALLFFFWVVGRPLWQAAHQLEHEQSEGGLALGLSLALGGSLVMNLFSLDFFLPQNFWFFSLACAAAAARFGTAPRVIAVKPEYYASILMSTVFVFMIFFVAAQASGRWMASGELQRGKRLATQFKLDQAIEVLQTAVSLDPANPESKYFLGTALAHRANAGDLKKAEQRYEETARLAPDYVLLHAKRAALYDTLGLPGQAEVQWKRQVDINPWLKFAWRGLASNQAKATKLKEASQSLERALKYFPGDADFEKNLQTVQRYLR